jgi:hypothetical protein
MAIAGDDAMTIPDYIAICVLIVCLLLVVAVRFLR